MEQILYSDSLKHSPVIEPSFKDTANIAETAPRLVNLHAFIKELSKTRRGFSLRRQKKPVGPDTVPKLTTSPLAVHSQTPQNLAQAPTTGQSIGSGHCSDTTPREANTEFPVTQGNTVENLTVPPQLPTSNGVVRNSDLDSIPGRSQEPLLISALKGKGKATEQDSAKNRASQHLGRFDPGTTVPAALSEDQMPSIEDASSNGLKRELSKVQNGGVEDQREEALEVREVRKSDALEDNQIGVEGSSSVRADPAEEVLENEHDLTKDEGQRTMSLPAQHEPQCAEQFKLATVPESLSQQSPRVSAVPTQLTTNEASEGTSSQTIPILQIKSASPLALPHYVCPVRTVSIVSSRTRVVPIFGKMSSDLYEALQLRPDKDSIRQWSTSWKPTIMKRLRDMHLGSHTITNLRFCLMGPTAEEKSMVPTILVVCAESKRKEVETSLTSFIKLSIPTGVDFKVVSSAIKPSSGVPELLDEGSKRFLNAKMRFTAPEDLFTLVGTQMRIQTRIRDALYPICTIGGVISVGNSLYALSVAHSMFGTASEVEDHYASLDWISYGNVHSYEWSGNETQYSMPIHDLSHQDNQIERLAIDWMLIRLGSDFMLPNIFNDPEDANQRPISGFLGAVDLEDGDVCICGGVTGTQYGILDTTPTSILYGQASYEVLSIALEHPLADGDSGAWVIQTDKLCGYIFARLEEKPWGYMLPIEPILQDIARAVSSNDFTLSVNVPDASTIDFLRSLAPTHSSPAASADVLSSDIPETRAIIVTNGGDTAGKAVYMPPKVSFPAAPTRPVPGPPTTQPRIPERASTDIMETGDLSQVPARNERRGPHTVFGPNDSPVANPLRSKLRHWSAYSIKVWLKDVFLWSTVFLLASLAGSGYLIYYIAKKTSVPVYAKVLASLAAFSISPAILIALYSFLYKSKRRPAPSVLVMPTTPTYTTSMSYTPGDYQRAGSVPPMPTYMSNRSYTSGGYQSAKPVSLMPTYMSNMSYTPGGYQHAKPMSPMPEPSPRLEMGVPELGGLVNDDEIWQSPLSRVMPPASELDSSGGVHEAYHYELR